MDFILTWNPEPIFFSIGNFIDIRYYSLMWLIGLALGYFVVRYLYRDQHIPDKLFDPLFLYCFFGILIGARIGHCLFYEPEYYLQNPLEIILPVKYIDGSLKFVGYQGLASHGGAAGLMLALWIYARKTKINIWTVLDNIAIATPITACFIRIGNFMNSEIIGKPTNGNWGVVFLQEDTTPRHPAQLYEAIAYLIIFIGGIYIYNRYKDRLHKGFFFGYCLATIFIFRFFIEFIKEHQVAYEESMSLNMGQWLSIPFIIIGLFFMLYRGLGRRSTRAIVR